MRLLAASVLFVLCASAQDFTVGSKITELNLDGATISPSKSAATVLIFVSTQCPISNSYNERMNALYKEYSAKGIQFAFVNANVNESPSEIEEHAKSNHFAFKIYKDAGNVLADKFGANVTPETFVFDKSGVLRYHGYIDDATNPARVQVHGLRQAIDAVVSGRPVEMKEARAFGCTIKRVRKRTS
jgi:thiol-disulfide isomerase/thioredoxin